jgi:hypothetical protein
MPDTTKRRSGAAGKQRQDQSGGAGSRQKPTADGSMPPSPPSPPLCSVAFCPICTMVTAMGEARPELVEHLLLAGREMLLAARAVIDARLEGMDADEAKTKLERITIE